MARNKVMITHEEAYAVRFVHEEFGKTEGRTADPSTSLRFGRDDSFVWELWVSFPR